MATKPPLPTPAPRFSFLTNGLLLPARKPRLFGQVMALTAASYACLSILPLHGHVTLAGAFSLLASMTVVGVVVGTITTCTAVATCGSSGSSKVVAKALDGGIITAPGPVATAVHAQIASATFHPGAAALAFVVDLLVRYTRSALLR